MNIPVEKLYAYRFGEAVPIAQSRVFQAIKEIYENPEIENSKTLYWELMDWFIGKNGHALGWVRSDKDKDQRVNDVKKLIKSLQENGYRKELEGRAEIEGFVYGDISAREEGGNYGIIDGHHRICVLILMGNNFIEARICE